MTPTRVVAVDDDTSISAMLDVVLRLEGYEVYLAVDAEDAIDLVAQVHPAVVVIDIMMPGMDGRELAERLREDPATGDVGIVFYSALDRDDDVWQGWLAGADSYVPKSADVTRLADEVRRVAADRGADPPEPG